MTNKKTKFTKLSTESKDSSPNEELNPKIEGIYKESQGSKLENYYTLARKKEGAIENQKKEMKKPHLYSQDKAREQNEQDQNALSNEKKLKFLKQFKKDVNLPKFAYTFNPLFKNKTNEEFNELNIERSEQLNKKNSLGENQSKVEVTPSVTTKLEKQVEANKVAPNVNQRPSPRSVTQAPSVNQPLSPKSVTQVDSPSVNQPPSPTSVTEEPKKLSVKDRVAALSNNKTLDNKTPVKEVTIGKIKDRYKPNNTAEPPIKEAPVVASGNVANLKAKFENKVR